KQVTHDHVMDRPLRWRSYGLAGQLGEELLHAAAFTEGACGPACDHDRALDVAPRDTGELQPPVYSDDDRGEADIPEIKRAGLHGVDDVRPRGKERPRGMDTLIFKESGSPEQEGGMVQGGKVADPDRFLRHGSANPFEHCSDRLVNTGEFGAEHPDRHVHDLLYNRSKDRGADDPRRTVLLRPGRRNDAFLERVGGVAPDGKFLPSEF